MHIFRPLNQDINTRRYWKLLWNILTFQDHGFITNITTRSIVDKVINPKYRLQSMVWPKQHTQFFCQNFAIHWKYQKKFYPGRAMNKIIYLNITTELIEWVNFGKLFGSLLIKSFKLVPLSSPFSHGTTRVPEATLYVINGYWKVG